MPILPAFSVGQRVRLLSVTGLAFVVKEVRYFDEAYFYGCVSEDGKCRTANLESAFVAL